MGTLADLIVASKSDAQAIVASDYPLGEYSGVNVDGLNPLHLAALHSSLAGKDFGQVVGAYEPVAEASPSGPWLIKLPADLIESLISIAPQDQASVAASWVRVEQVSGEGWSEQEAESFVARLVHFSQTASFEKQELFLCAYD